MHNSSNDEDKQRQTSTESMEWSKACVAANGDQKRVAINFTELGLDIDHISLIDWWLGGFGAATNAKR